MKDLNTRKHLLLLNVLRTIAESTTEVETDPDAETGTITIPVFRWQPQFEFDEEDIQTIKELSNEEGEDFSILTGDEEN